MEQIRFHIFLSISLHTKIKDNQTETKKEKEKRQPVVHFEWHNLCPVASCKYQSEIPLIPSNLHGFHQPVKAEHY